ncbi:MAG TPA: PadR family transcriptional regulator [Aggregatilineales bacterium]|nr:PadR family transcriptional regulator [Aggregatilineales bacterium]
MMAAALPDSATDDLLAYIALGLLMPEPRHGYALYQDFVEMFGPVWQAGRSKFYATLADLHEKAGLLDAEMAPQENRPPRKVYHITEAGRDAFERWLLEPVAQPREVRTAIPVKLRFFEMLGLPGAEALLDAQIAVCQARLDREMRRASNRAGENDFFYELLYEFRRSQLAGMIDWLHTCRARFAGRRGQIEPHSLENRD